MGKFVEVGIQKENKEGEKEKPPFDVDTEVDAYLISDRKVLLIQGGGGSGKSLFCHMLIRKILKDT